MPKFFNEIEDVYEVSETVKEDAKNVETRARSAIKSLENLIEEVNQIGVDAENVEKISQRIVSGRNSDTYKEDGNREPNPTKGTANMIAEMSREINQEAKIENQIENTLKQVREYLNAIEHVHIEGDEGLVNSIERLGLESQDLKEKADRREASNQTDESYDN
jgi:flagellar basal body P-ring protein FlgI